MALDNYINHILSQCSDNIMYGEYVSTLEKTDLIKSLEALHGPITKELFIKRVDSSFVDYKNIIAKRIKRENLDVLAITTNHFTLFCGSAKDYSDKLSKLYTDTQELLENLKLREDYTQLFTALSNTLLLLTNRFLWSVSEEKQKADSKDDPEAKKIPVLMMKIDYSKVLDVALQTKNIPNEQDLGSLIKATKDERTWLGVAGGSASVGGAIAIVGKLAMRSISLPLTIGYTGYKIKEKFDYDRDIAKLEKVFDLIYFTYMLKATYTRLTEIEKEYDDAW